MPLRALTAAIRAIPTQRLSWDPNQALSLFTYGSLEILTVASVEMEGRPVLARLYEAIKEGPPLVPSEEQIQAVQNACLAYLRAVVAREPFADVLSLVHAEFLGKFGGNGLGQHFTPWDLADLQGALAADHHRRHPVSGWPIRLYEPASGAGGLLLGQLRAWEGDTRSLCITANDLDPLCAAMTALQLLANQLVCNKPFRECAITVGDALLGNERLAFASVCKRSPMDQTWDAYKQAMHQLVMRPRHQGVAESFLADQGERS